MLRPRAGAGAARRLQAAAEHAAVCRAADDAWQRWLRAAHTAREGLGTPQFLHLVDVAADYEMEARHLSNQVVEFSHLLGGRLWPQVEPAPAPPRPKAQRLRE